MSKPEEAIHNKLRSVAWKAFLLSDLSQLIDSKDPETLQSQFEIEGLSEDVQTLLDSKPVSCNQIVHSFLVSAVEFFCSAKSRKYSPGLAEIAYVLRQEGSIHDLDDLQWCFLSFCNHFVPEPDSISSLSTLFRLLIIYHDPLLFCTLETKKVSIEEIAVFWLTRAFAGVCSDHVTANIWSHLFSQPDPFLIIFIAYALLTSVGERLNQQSEEDCYDFIIKYPQSMEEGDVKDCVMFANYFLNRTPSTFREVYAHVFHGGTCSPNFGDISSTSLCISISVRDILSYHRNEAVKARMKYFFVDCRSLEDFEKGHQKGSYHVDSECFLEDPTPMLEGLQEALNDFKSSCKKGQDHVCLIGYTYDDPCPHNPSATVYPILSQLLKMRVPRVSLLIEGYRGLHDCFHEDSNIIVSHNPRFCMYCNRISSQSSKLVSETFEMGSKILDDLKSTVKKTYEKSKKSSFFSFIRSQYSSLSFSGSSDQQVYSLESLKSRPEHRHCFECREVSSNGDEMSIYIFLTDKCMNFYRAVSGGDYQLFRYKELTDIVRISTKSTDSEQLTFRFGRYDDGELIIDSVAIIKIRIPDVLVEAIKELISQL